MINEENFKILSVPNAGIVLISSLFPPLFKKLGMLDRSGNSFKDIDSKNGIINIDKSYQRIKAKDTIGPPKTENSFRKVDIPQFLCDQLEEYLKKHYILNEDDRIFKEYYVIIRDRLKKAQKRANLNEEFTLHSFRYSHVSLLIDLGYSPTIVADRIGDTVDTVLKTYSHLYAESKESLSEKLNNLYK